MDKDFATNGYKIDGNEQVRKANKKTLSNLCELLEIETESDLNSISGALAKMFHKSRDRYTGLLKAFANTPDILNYATGPHILELVKKCGVKRPSLVTPPILHVVSEQLIINRAKVFTPPHQDVISTKGSVGQVVVWIPLHAVKTDNYGIQAWPGSHLQGQLPTDFSDFGHTVRADLVPDQKSKYLEMEDGEICVFSQYLIHETCKSGKFRMAVSFRFNDAADPDWAARNYFSPFTRSEDKTEYQDSRQNAPISVTNYFGQ